MSRRGTERLSAAGPDAPPPALGPSTAPPAPVKGRPPILQWLLLGATVLLSGLGLLATLTGRQEWALILFVTAVYVLFLFTMGVSRWPVPRRKGRRRRGGTATKGSGDPVSHRPSWQPDDASRQGTAGQRQPGGDQYRDREPLRVPASASASGRPETPGPAGPAGLEPMPPGDWTEPYNPLPDPPDFGRSAAGQAPWLLPALAPHSGLAADAARLGDLEVRAASVVGPGHRCEEPAEARQDAYALSRTADGRYLVVAVADGLASSRHSDLGARLAVSASVRELRGMVGSEGMQTIDPHYLYKVIAGEMVGTGRSRQLDDGEICSILITAVIPTSPGPDGVRVIWASWIGDVSLWCQRGQQLERLTGHDKSGLDRNALNAVLPFDPDQVEHAQFRFEAGDRIAIMTDGLSDSLTDVAGVAAFFADQWAGPPPHPATFLHGLCYDAPGQADDRTAVVIWTGLGRSSFPGQPA